MCCTRNKRWRRLHNRRFNSRNDNDGNNDKGQRQHQATSSAIPLMAVQSREKFFRLVSSRHTHFAATCTRLLLLPFVPPFRSKNKNVPRGRPPPHKHTTHTLFPPVQTPKTTIVVAVCVRVAFLPGGSDHQEANLNLSTGHGC